MYALSFLIQVTLHLSLKVNSVKISPSFYYLSNKTIHVFLVNEAFFSFHSYEWLHNFVKALDEI